MCSDRRYDDYIPKPRTWQYLNGEDLETVKCHERLMEILRRGIDLQRACQKRKWNKRYRAERKNSAGNLKILISPIPIRNFLFGSPKDWNDIRMRYSRSAMREVRAIITTMRNRDKSQCDLEKDNLQEPLKIRSHRS
jgi:hypothetical protein